MDELIKNFIEYPKSGILSKDLVIDKKNNVTLFCMSKGSSMSEHTSTKSGFIYVIEGKGIFNLKGKKIKMEPGRFIFMKENDKHSLNAQLNTSFILSLR
jgi:quercetin dioxygenase-like cupin family protein